MWQYTRWCARFSIAKSPHCLAPSLRSHYLQPFLILCICIFFLSNNSSFFNPPFLRIIFINVIPTLKHYTFCHSRTLLPLAGNLAFPSNSSKPETR
ncbi:hypothetical protein NC651_009303 [Populus alba x Populus x berolinensis]|nr:hypothetical protein NC651_009303 [Populus alba x Populus x berolinensis]